MRRKRSPDSAFCQPGSTPNRRFAQKMTLASCSGQVWRSRAY
jgi:hypothetical protein